MRAPAPFLALASLLLASIAAGCGEPDAPATQATEAPVAGERGAQGNLPPTEATLRVLAAAAAALPLDDPADQEASERGLVAREDDVRIETADGRVVWDTASYGFETGAAPDSVHPSLWRQAKLNNLHGLYRVTDRIHQVRGYDLSNLSLIQGDTGWIVVDPLTAEESAAAAMALARKHLGDQPVVAVILTHSHIDHFGGIRGVASEEDLTSGRIRIVAPAHFVAEATSENVLAGVAMGRRSSFMYGFNLERSPVGHVGSGLGKEPARGTFAIVPPTDVVDRTPQEMVIDGVRFVFQYTPESEAPAELTFYLPDDKAFCGAEVVSRNLHNLYTPRGAKVRDALKWSGYIDEALVLFPEAEVAFASHHWPTFGREAVRDYLKKQRDSYKYIHDQTLRLANAGYTPREIAEQLELPPELASSFPNRGYYGTVRHNAKAVYQGYFGWYDGNPAHLDPLPPEPAAKRYVAAMGGAASVLATARAAFDEGDYRWVATLVDHLVFAEPGNDEARELLARAYDQLGYQAESGPWRDIYLTGALELRYGTTPAGIDLAGAADLLRHTPVSRFFDSMAARIDGTRATGEKLVLNFVFTDVGETHVLRLENAVLNHRREDAAPEANATVRLTKDLWLRLVTGQVGLRELIFSDELAVEGSRLDVLSLFRLMDRPEGSFAIVTP